MSRPSSPGQSADHARAATTAARTWTTAQAARSIRMPHKPRAVVIRTRRYGHGFRWGFASRIWATTLVAMGAANDASSTY